MGLKYRHSILCVDDEMSVTNSLHRLFRKEGYQIFTASSGQEGLEVLKKSEKPISLIICDQRMPGMTGTGFFEKAKEISPNATRFLLTGFSDMDATVEAINKGQIHRYLTKPWDTEDLKLQVRQVLEQYELRLENRRLEALAKKQNVELNNLNKDLEQKVQERSREIMEKNKELQASLFNTVRAFASLAEMHTPSIAGHGRRVGALSRDIARILKLSEEEVVRIEIGALLHDVGKLGLPQKLLEYKAQRWNQKEEALFRKHPEEGQALVSFIKGIEHIGPLIRWHHERFDGHGYPDHIREEDIPLGSRIIAVADVYDKIVNLKVDVKSYINEYLRETKGGRYQTSNDEMEQNAAIHHLRQYAFTWYDPDVVKAFLDVLKAKGIQYRKEKMLSIRKLREGMVLSRALYSSKGRFLLPQDAVLTEEYISKLKTIDEYDPIDGVVYG